MAPITVLLVDDNAAFRRMAARYLEERSPGDVTVVGSVARGEDALVEAARLHPQVVLVDLRMPGLTGFETIPRLRRILPETGIIALSLLDSHGYRQAVLAVGADDFVAKASMGRDLLPAIQRIARADITRTRGADGHG
jgi:DNA-binding NarL/FixJ family response regulator